MKLSRRLFLGRTATASASLAASMVAVEAVAETSPHGIWAELVRSLSHRVPDDCRLQFYGSAAHLRVEVLRRQIEQVHPKVRMPVERIIASYRMGPNGWVEEGIYPIGGAQ